MGLLALAWAPHLQGDIDKLENVQHRATKTISALRHESYEQRLAELGLITLKERRARMDLVQQYKITHGLEQIEFFVPQSKPRWQTSGYAPRRHKKSLQPQCVYNCEERGAFFTNRVVARWNALSEETVNVQSLYAFKEMLKA